MARSASITIADASSLLAMEKNVKYMYLICCDELSGLGTHWISYFIALKTASAGRSLRNHKVVGADMICFDPKNEFKRDCKRISENIKSFMCLRLDISDDSITTHYGEFVTKQEDGINCGGFCIAALYNIIHKINDLKVKNLEYFMSIECEESEVLNYRSTLSLSITEIFNSIVSAFNSKQTKHLKRLLSEREERESNHNGVASGGGIDDDITEGDDVTGGKDTLPTGTATGNPSAPMDTDTGGKDTLPTGTATGNPSAPMDTDTAVCETCPKTGHKCLGCDMLLCNLCNEGVAGMNASIGRCCADCKAKLEAATHTKWTKDDLKDDDQKRLQFVNHLRDYHAKNHAKNQSNEDQEKQEKEKDDKEIVEQN
eukprot:951675_1